MQPREAECRPQADGGAAAMVRADLPRLGAKHCQPRRIERFQHCYTRFDLGVPGPSHLGTWDCTNARYADSETALSGHGLRQPPHRQHGDIVLLAEGLGGVGDVERGLMA